MTALIECIFISADIISTAFNFRGFGLGRPLIQELNLTWPNLKFSDHFNCGNN